MASEFTIMAIQKGSQLLGSLLKSAILQPSKSQSGGTSTPVSSPESVKPIVITGTKPTEKAEIKPIVNPSMLTSFNTSKSATETKLFKPETVSNDDDYRWECMCKHLGAAAVLFREAHERAITDKAVTEGVAEKVMAALNEHAGADDDLKPMLRSANSKAAAEHMMDGLRALRRAAWDCEITTGGQKATVEDVADARMWNDILFQDAYSNAKKKPGKECLMSGM